MNIINGYDTESWGKLLASFYGKLHKQEEKQALVAMLGVNAQAIKWIKNIEKLTK
ncbi:MAG: hypothetical protein IJJ33_09360 [Victivallales bacterium]|nr:hypothetical protein [Victivallales bacterium]